MNQPTKANPIEKLVFNDEELTLPDLSLLLPTMLSNGGFSGPAPTNSRTLYSNNFKLGRMFGISF